MLTALTSLATSAQAQLGLVLAQVSARPDPNGLPGSSAAEKLINGLFFFALLACLAGLLISVMTWTVASRVQNHHHAHNGKIGTLVAAGGALLCGAAPALINFFFDAGQAVR